MTTPQWRGKHNGLLGDAAAMTDSGDVNQLLGTHAAKVIYTGTLNPNAGANSGVGGPAWGLQLSTLDIDEPVILNGTVIGRVVIPLLAVGQGADLLVSLCADASGVPGTVITQTRVPASWIFQSSAVSGASVPSSDAPIMEYTGNPLAVSQVTGFHMDQSTVVPWPYPTGSGGGPTASPCSTAFGSYLILLGGHSGSAYYANVYTVQADTLGNLAPAVPQPSLPVATDGTGTAIVVTDTNGGDNLVFLGGATAAGATSAVYTASFDAASGTVAAWSVQPSLPAPLQYFGAATYNGCIYTVGGFTGGAATSAVHYAMVSNGQIGTWQTARALPTALFDLSAFAVNGYLVAYGGSPDGVNFALNTYYAVIASDGSIGPWLPGPALPGPYALTGNAQLSAGNWGFFSNDQGEMFSIGFGPTGPDFTWRNDVLSGADGQFYGFVESGTGTWQYYDLATTSYATTAMTLTPWISVPLPATGLTNGGTYHVLLQQQGGDLNNYLRTHLDNNALNGSPTALTSPRGSYTWTAQPSLNQVPIELWDGLPQAPGQKPLHFWEDSGARITTVARATTPDQRPLGILEATAMPTAQNQNQGFETTLSPWVPNGGTGVRSGARAYEGLWSAQMTPSGSAANVYFESELLPCMPGQSITVSCWVWCTHAVTSNFSMSVNWYTLGNVYIGTSSNEISVPAATWTFVSNVFTATTSGGGAYRYTLAPNLSGTPAASNVYFVDVVLGGPSFVGAQQTSVNQYVYPPDTGYPPVRNPILPSAVVQLA